MPQPLAIYGIPNCDTVKKARAWLQERGHALPLHDFRKQGVPVQGLQAWMQALGWQALVNTRGTTWRGLPEATRAMATEAAGASAVLQAHPSAIRRPVVEWDDGSVTAGFDAADWSRRLGG